MGLRRTAVLVSLVFALAAWGAPARSQAEQTTTLKAFGGSETETKIQLRKGDRFEVKASGSWKIGGWIGSCGPDGFAAGEHTSYNITRDANHGALLCRVGSGDLQRVGSFAVLTADASGRLVFSPNDKEQGNNSGSLIVTVIHPGSSVPVATSGPSVVIVKRFEANGEGGTSPVKIETGDKVDVSATGRWTMGAAIGSCDPDGMDNAFAQAYNCFTDHLHGKLAVKIEGDDGWYVVGSSGGFTAEKSGYLMYKPNDTEPANNSGALNVKVTITRGEPSEKPSGDIRTASVPAATSGWRSDITVRRGQLVRIKAAGTWKMGDWIGSCDPDGMSGHTSYNVLPNRKHGSLLVMIEGDDGWYAVGKKGEFRAEVSGRLIFRPNDLEPNSNAGSLNVTVEVED